MGSISGDKEQLHSIITSLIAKHGGTVAIDIKDLESNDLTLNARQSEAQLVLWVNDTQTRVNQLSRTLRDFFIDHEVLTEQQVLDAYRKARDE